MRSDALIPGSEGEVAEGALLWEPSPDRQAAANITRYLDWLEPRLGSTFDSYEDLWRWSVDDLEGFWSSIWEFFEILAHRPYKRVLRGRGMPDVGWFPGAELNYAEHALRRRGDHPAVIARSETRPDLTLSFEDLRQRVGAARAGFQLLGVERGDRVVALAPVIPETLIAFLAVASLGAIWSSCAPEFGARSVVSRFRQTEPKVLLGVDGYRYGGRAHERLATLAEIQGHLPTLEATVVIPYLEEGADAAGLRGLVWWDALQGEAAEPQFDPLPFDHPLWIVYSSGTTGPPKGIVHGHGGITLELHKMLSLHSDLGPDDRFFWFTTTGWVMWNYLMSGLLVGATVVMYDGSPAHPDLGALWQLAADLRVTYLGTSAPFIHASMREGIEPNRHYELGALRSLGSTGAPLSPEGYRWVYQHVGEDLLLASISGGTDVATAFLTSCPLLPVRAGELQCRALGTKAEAFDPNGRSVLDQLGELVITRPMPSMPVSFWNDPDGLRYRESYFEMYPGIWRHGDWVKITSRGSAVIYGRSDSTLNRGGVRMGTSEFYRVVEELPEIADSLVVDCGQPGEAGSLLLFVVLAEDSLLTEELRERIRRKCREDLSPRHVPDEIHAAGELPRTLSGKKLEVPIKKILAGMSPDEVVRRDALVNPQALDDFVTFAEQKRPREAFDPPES